MSMEHWWNDMGRKTDIFGEKPVPLPLCLPQIPDKLVSDWTQNYSDRLTANHLCHGMHKIVYTSDLYLHVWFSPGVWLLFFMNLKLWPPLYKSLWIPTCFAWSATQASWISCTDLSGFRGSTLLWDSAVLPALSSFTSFDAGRGVRARWTT